MEIYNPKEDRVMSEQEFRRMFPNKSFPAKLTPEIIEEQEFSVLEKDPIPTYDQDVETVTSKIVATKDGYRKTYVVEEKPLSPAEKGNITKAKNEQKKQADLMALKDAYRKHVYSVFDIEQIALIAALYHAMTAEQMTKADAVIAWVKTCLKYYLDQKQNIENKKPFETDFTPPLGIVFEDIINGRR